MVSGTIQLPSELYWISPPFKIKRQISLSPCLDPTGRITLFFPDSPGACTLYLPPFQKILYITLSTVEFYYLSYAFLNTKKNSKKVYYFFLQHFSTHKKDMCGVYMYYNLYYVAILCIVVLSKHYNDNGKKCECYYCKR